MIILVLKIGKTSLEYEHFSKLKFYYNPEVLVLGSDYPSEHLNCFREDFKLLMDTIDTYIEELNDVTEDDYNRKTILDSDNKINKVFISHSSMDSEIVEEIIEILEAIGLESTQIFCTSFEGYGIELGNNFLEEIKNELSSDALVLFVLSQNFYNSPVSMCEMGATWILSKEHIPLIVPPLTYEDIKGVIPLTQGMILNEPMKLNSFKEKIEKIFEIDTTSNFSTWERKRDRICKRINNLITK